MTTLRALEIEGGLGTTAVLPRTIEHLSLLTSLRVSRVRTGEEGLDLSRLYELRVLHARNCGLSIDNTTLSADNLPHLLELKFKPGGAVPQAAFRAGLRKLVVEEARGPLPLAPAVAHSLNLVDLELQTYWYTELPEALGRLSALTRLCIEYGNLERLPLSLQNLPNLEQLTVKCTRVTSMPPLAALNKLKHLDINHNYLSALPEGVISLPSLEAIDLGFNCMYTLRWADLRMLPLCYSMYSDDAQGTRYASYDPTNRELMPAIRMRPQDGDYTTRVYATVEL